MSDRRLGNASPPPSRTTDSKMWTRDRSAPADLSRGMMVRDGSSSADIRTTLAGPSGIDPCGGAAPRETAAAIDSET